MIGLIITFLIMIMKFVLYPSMGAIIGGTLTYVICKLKDVSFKAKDYVPFSEGQVYVMLATMFSASLGLGYFLHDV